MKTNWFITLSLLCAAGLAQADGMPTERPAGTAEAASEAAKAQPVKKTYTRTKRLPRGDLRHCLDLKTREEIIRCSETRKRK